MDTGDNSGTWGTVTNTNLELIGEAFGFGTEAITTNADTHASTIADGSTDPVRAMYVKYTGALDSNCTVTIGPNTVNKFYFIENATTDSGSSGPYSLIISQGSGANITVPNGQTKAVYLDGAGSGAAVVDAFAALNVVDFTVQDDLSLSSDSAVINFGADSDITLTHTADTSLTLGGAGSTTGLLINNTATDGDPFLSFALSGTQTFTMGVDDGDSDKFKIGTTAIGTNTRMTIDSSGNLGVGVTTVQSSANGKTLETSGCLVVGGNLAAHQTDRGVFEYQGNAFQMRSYGASAGTGEIAFRTGGGGGSADSESMRIDSSGRVGVGAAPNSSWRDDIANQKVLMLGTEATLFSDSGVTTALLNNALINDADTFVNISERGASQYFQYQGAHKWYTAASASAGADINTEMTTQKMQLDISGNLIVGSDSASFNNTAKTVIRPGADNWAISPGVAYSFNRSGGSGDILEFYETSSSKAGVIGSANGADLYIGNDDTGLLFAGGSDMVIPWNPSTPASRDNAISLGSGSHRFKDAYISGGIYFQGDTTAVQFDDYEEGTFDAAITTTGGSVTLNSSYNKMSYTKIGRQVTVFGLIITSAVSSPSGPYVRITGLPFTSINLAEGSGRSGGSVSFWNGSAMASQPYEISESDDKIVIYLDASTVTAGDDFYVAATYQAA
tara:strand:- start:2364 stop:4385 length:2022 start_codon:yes stop_codon:yes gene_type:complete